MLANLLLDRLLLLRLSIGDLDLSRLIDIEEEAVEEEEEEEEDSEEEEEEEKSLPFTVLPGKTV